MRCLFLAGFAVLASTGCAQAGPFTRRANCTPTPVAPPPAPSQAQHGPLGRLVEGRYPFIATVLRPGTEYAPRLPNGRRLIYGAAAVETAANVISFSSNVALSTVGIVAPSAFRLSRIALLGSPVPGPRRDTVLWVISPYLLGFRNAVRERRAASGEPPVFEGPGYGPPTYLTPANPYSVTPVYVPPVVYYPVPGAEVVPGR